jgi:hypothetical protein
MAVDHQATERPARSGSSAGVSRPRATESKQSFKTTEFFAYVAAVAGVVIAAAVVGSSDDGQDAFGARSAWLYITILTVGYMVSRGLAKSGSREPTWGHPDA